MGKRAINMTPVKDRPRCRFCVKRLKEVTVYPDGYWSAPYNDKPAKLGTGTFGQFGHGFFCSQNCGYFYAERALMEGRVR